MMILNALNIPLSTILYEKDDYNRFMKAFDKTIAFVISNEFNPQINEESADKLEMISLWREIDLISKNVMSFSLDLIYESLDDVLKKLKTSINELIETGKEDLQIGFFLKYISMPDTMNKLLQKDET